MSLAAYSCQPMARAVPSSSQSARQARLVCRQSPLLRASSRCTWRSAQRQGRRQQRHQVVTAGLFGLGAPELAVIAGVAVLIFGPSKIPGLGKELGKTAKSFKQAANEFSSELQKASDEGQEQIKDAADQARKDIKPPS